MDFLTQSNATQRWTLAHALGSNETITSSTVHRGEIPISHFPWFEHSPNYVKRGTCHGLDVLFHHHHSLQFFISSLDEEDLFEHRTRYWWQKRNSPFPRLCDRTTLCGTNSWTNKCSKRIRSNDVGRDWRSMWPRTNNRWAEETKGEKKCYVDALSLCRTDDSGQTEYKPMSSKSPWYRRFYRDMLARLIVRLYRDKSWYIVDTDDFLVSLFEKLNMHKKRRNLHVKGSWHQIDDVGTSSTPFGSCLLLERKDRIGRKYV